MVERLLDSQLNLDQESEDRPADEPFSRKKEPVPLFSRAPDGLRGFYSIPSKESRMSQTQPGSTEEVGDRNPWGRSCMGSQRGRESSEGGGANFRRRVSLQECLVPSHEAFVELLRSKRECILERIDVLYKRTASARASLAEAMNAEGEENC